MPTGLKKANAAATTGFVSAGSTPTPSKVAATISSYRSALNLYYFQLHFIHWPASMQTATEVEYAQLQALMSFMQSFSTVSPAGISAVVVPAAQPHRDDRGRGQPGPP